MLINQASMTNPDNYPRGEWHSLPTNHTNYNEMVALIMVSHLKGHPWSFYVDGCLQCVSHLRCLSLCERVELTDMDVHAGQSL